MSGRSSQHDGGEIGTEHDGGGADAEAVREFGVTDLPGNPSRLHCLTIVGQIEGHVVRPSRNKTTKYEHIIPQLVGVEQNADVDGLIVLLNTVGGDVEAGLAIAELIHTMAKPTVSVVLGGGHSIGVPIAVATDRSFITSTATMTIHPLRLTGMVVGVPQTFEYVEKMQERVIGFVSAHSQISQSRYRELMFRTGQLARDVGTILVGEDAVTEGIINDVGGMAAAIEWLQRRIDGPPHLPSPEPQPPRWRPS